MNMEQLKQEYKVLSLVDWRDPTANNGCPLYHTKIVSIINWLHFSVKAV